MAKRARDLSPGVRRRKPDQPTTKQALSHVRQHIGPALKNARSMRRTFDKVFPLGKPRTFSARKGLTPLAVHTTYALLAKCSKTARAIELVCAGGLGNDALTLTRSLYETALTVSFILEKDSHQRAAMYHAHVAHQNLKMLRSWREVPALAASATDDLMAAAQETLDACLQHLPKGLDVSKHWSGYGNLEQAARTLADRGLSYQLAYRWLSQTAHAQDAIVHIHLGPTGQSAHIKLLPGDAYLRQALGISALILWTTIDQANRMLDLGMDRELVTLRERVLVETPAQATVTS